MVSIVEHLNLGNGQLKVLVKDSIDIQGTVCKAGSQALENNVEAEQHADIIEQILKNDCSIIGKTNLHELAFGITGINHFTGTPINPKYPAFICGGSSSGSAVAVAENLCDFSIGTDTGGSIRMPSACCGIYGLKPTFGRISRQGVLPAFSTLDCVGPMANTPSMLIQAMKIIDPTFNVEDKLDISTLKFVFLDVPAQTEIWQTIQDFFHDVGIKNIEKTTSSYMQNAFDAGMQVINYETSKAFAHLLESNKLGQDIQARLKIATLTTLADVDIANKIREQFTEEINQILSNFDVLALPTLPSIPPKVLEVENSKAVLNLTALIRPFNLSGHPALNIPLETSHGLPVGLQLIAKHGQDEKLCFLAKALLDRLNSNQNRTVE
ncbi:amidase [Acinetobacter sp. ANC 4558]|uniref:amidase n=1 Tax=Acinetobacter sp. ANC 4558 TaxID=1977876 RepID=UPI000A351D6A|nr:amidase [Acinetobacter sp. ANC 4558]OTG86147.1 amidase [Acinetobacter sp. ANC 4558]